MSGIAVPACQSCGKKLPRELGTKLSSRSVRYCSGACRQRAYRERAKSGAVVSERTPIGLCTHVSTFHGRERDMQSLEQLRDASRLLTLVGPPGVGKTRLAMEWLKRVPETRWGEVVLVDVGKVGDGELMQAVADAAAIPLDPHEPPAETLCVALAGMGAVHLLLDNAEHRLDEIGALLAVLLPRCGRLRVLATSREVPRLPGEMVYSVKGLPVDDVSPDDQFRSDALSLFADRARSSCPDLLATDADTAVIGEICDALDGVPLAIELAAGLVRVLPLVGIRDALRDEPWSLSLGWRTADPRHQSMAAAVDWSLERLTEMERTGLLRLSVLPDGFELDAAVAVAAVGSSADTVNVLRGLESQSMVVIDSHSPAPRRFRIPAPIRWHALRLLDASGERPSTLDRLVSFLAALAAPAARVAAVPRSAAARFAAEHDTVRHTMDRLAGTSDPRRLLLAGLLPYGRGNREESCGLISRVHDALAAVGPDAEHRGFALGAAAVLTLCEDGALDDAVELADNAVWSLRATDVVGPLARQLRIRSIVHSHRGDLQAAVADLTEHQRICRALGDEHATVLGEARLAIALLGRADFGAAAEVLARSGGAADPALAGDAFAHAVGLLALAGGEAESAEKAFCGVLRRVRPDSHLVPWCLEGLAVAARLVRSADQTLFLAAGADRLRNTMAVPAEPWWARQVADAVAEAQSSLPSSKSETTVRTSLRLSPEWLRRYALDGLPNPKALPAQVTLREAEVVELIAQGMTNRQIAAALHLSLRTVESHVRNVKERLQLRSRAHLAAWAARACSPNVT